MTLIENNAVVLFQGDSITDAGRNRETGADFGWGYANIIASLFTNRYPEKEVKFLNRGIGGDRVVDLERRWEADCLALAPTWVSVHIGINDTWRRYDNNSPMSVDEYASAYRRFRPWPGPAAG